MGNNFDKTKAILNGDESKYAIALKTMALDLDTKFKELEDKNTERHEALMKAIADNKKQTYDKSSEKIKVVMFFGESEMALLNSCRRNNHDAFYKFW